jgi:hypothetical protein
MSSLDRDAARYGFLVRRSRRVPDRYWLVDSATGRLASPWSGETADEVASAVQPVNPSPARATG